MAEVGTDLPTTFGKYYLTEKLATGGMAEIYLGKLIGPGGFEKQMVIKQIHPRLSDQRHFVDLFVAEAKTLVALAHGNIVPVYELGVVDDIYFIAMDYIDGPTLYRLTETMAGRDALMEPALAAWITARILEGLDYAHRKGEGVIHRDLSPRNVMLSRDGEVKLVDFGIAQTLGEPGESEDAQSAPTGSFPYMSPEQVRREALSPRTDLFSAGVLLWEMLVGRRLFARPDPDATLDAVLRGDIARPSTGRPDVPAKLDEVVMRALERDHEGRWESAGDMLDALNRYLYSLDATPGPRDVAALVGRFCPPGTRRLPTHLEAAAQDAAADEPPLPGPRTAVIPRDGSAKGKRPRRLQTFATNVEMKDLLERATPMIPFDAIRDEPAPVGELVRRPPSRALLVIAALGVMALGIAAIYAFFEGRARVLRADAGVDARALDAAPVVAPTDAAAEPDASPVAIDAGRRDHDAHLRPAADAGPAAPATGTATLEIGAIPWGEIYVDGEPRGTTPKDLVVRAGHHSIEVVFTGETPPRKQAFAVDLAAGEAKALVADFK